MSKVPPMKQIQDLRKKLSEIRSYGPRPYSQSYSEIVNALDAAIDARLAAIEKWDLDTAGGTIQSTDDIVPYVKFEHHWDDFRVAPQNMDNIPSIDGPALSKLGDDGAGSIGVYGLAFDKNKDEAVAFDVQLPHGWREGTIIYPHVHWCPVDGTSGDVVWQLEYTTFTNVGEIIDTSTNVISVADAADGTAYKHQVIGLPPISMDNKEVSTLTLCCFSRQGSAAGDTYGSDAILLSFDIHIEMDSLGSAEQFTKV
jgi:hypothetical protein